MSNPILLVTVVLFAAIGVVLTYLRRRHLAQALQASFLTLRIPVGRESVGAESVRVVRRASAMTTRGLFSDGYPVHDDSAVFWYVVAPGPTYLLAMGTPVERWGRTDVSWILRPLDEARMRGALADDPKALALAFGAAAETLPTARS